MSARLTPAPPGYQPVKIDGRWAIIAYATDRTGAITQAAPITDARNHYVLTWSRRKFAIRALLDDLLTKEVEMLRAEVRRLRDATSAANVVAS